jgi:signal transduction histidine kinase
MTPGGNRSVLLVEDHRRLVDNLTEVLEEEGYRVRSVTSCADALAAAQQGDLSVAVVDQRLPDGDGIELARRLRELRPRPEVVLMTGFATMESATAAVRAGVWAYLVKPCATRELLMVIAQAQRHLDETRALSRRAQVAEGLATVGRMAAGLSHEIRNPLNAASLQLQVLQRRLRRLPAEQHAPLLEPLGIVQEEIARLNRILEEFLQLSRQRGLERAPHALRELVAKVRDLLLPEAEAHEVGLAAVVAGEPRLECDADRLQQALVNLVLNAIQATPRGGAVRLVAQPSDGGVELRVEDGGPGVPEELRARVFEPFFTTKPAGSGLGLPIVHAIVAQHGGTIVYEPSALGGACFVLRLPLS